MTEPQLQYTRRLLHKMVVQVFFMGAAVFTTLTCITVSIVFQTLYWGPILVPIALLLLVTALPVSDDTITRDV